MDEYVALCVKWDRIASLPDVRQIHTNNVVTKAQHHHETSQAYREYDLMSIALNDNLLYNQIVCSQCFFRLVKHRNVEDLSAKYLAGRNRYRPV